MRTNSWWREPEKFKDSCPSPSWWQNRSPDAPASMCPDKKPSAASRKSWKANTTMYPSKISTLSAALTKYVNHSRFSHVLIINTTPVYPDFVRPSLCDGGEYKIEDPR